MVDIVSKAVRSRMMAGIRGKNTSPEMKVRQHLHARGFRYRIHSRALPGIPDIVLAKYQLVIFVHGCFWHRHAGCRYASCPQDPQDKWGKKFRDTVVRDLRVTDKLLSENWRVFILWECGLTKGGTLESLEWLDDAIKDMSVRFLNWPTPTVHPPSADDYDFI
jgi:DNA mismatch endonuclease (patch repair protein)